MMQPTRRSISLAVALLCVASVPARARAQSSTDSVAKQIDQIFARFTPDVPGCAVAVYQNGAVRFAKGYGSANLEYGIPITATTPFIVGSVSKQFTAAAIALLIEDGKLKLTDDVRTYVPELADYGTPITIDHLVHHTSGLRDWWELVSLAGLRNDDTYAVQDVLDMTARQRGLNFKPGDRYLYSNTGYILLGMVVQRVSGKSLRQFADERIFRPLGMTNTHFHDNHTEIARGRAVAYSPAGGSFTINVWNNDLVGQGGVMTTVLDLAKWDENFYHGRVGGPAFLARQLQQGKLNSGATLVYAFGLEVKQYRGLDVVEHTGSTGGYRSVITRYPKEHTSIAALCNVSNAAPQTLAQRAADVLLRNRMTASAAGARGAPPAATTANSDSAPPPARGQVPAAGGRGGAAAARPTAAVLARLAGRYYSDELDATYEVVSTGASVSLKRPRGRVDSLTVRDSVTAAGAAGTLRFALGRDGRAESFVLTGGRVENIKFTRR
jgi:CubicO group peptidase (beta-lactamase class C family)